MDSDNSKGSRRSSKRSAPKKVSFSIIEVSTFEEIAKIRKKKEEELDNFISNKIKTNQLISTMKVKNNLKQNNLSKNNQKKIKEDINILNMKNKEHLPLKYYLTDEDNESGSLQLKNINKNILSKDINKNNKIIKKENIEKFIKIIYNIIYLNNNKIKKKKIKKEIFEKLKNYNEYLINNYLDYENNDIEYNNFIESKKIFFIKKIMYDKFIKNIKEMHYNKLIHQKNKEEANKFYLYSLYKKKVLAFDALKNYAIKQKIWIQSIQAGLKKQLIWSCLDNWKLYLNYKNAKRYLKLRKKKVIFDALRNNKQLSINLLKQGKKMSLILEYRHFFNNIRKRILSEKAKDINNKLLSEFRRQNLMKNLFNVIKENHRRKKERDKKYKKIFLNKYEDKDFINIKISNKETYKINGEVSIKKIQNKINI